MYKLDNSNSENDSGDNDDHDDGDTANLPTNIVDFKGFDSSVISF